MAWLEMIKRDLPGQSFIQVYRILDRNALAFRVEQRVDRQAATPFIEGHHDPVRLRNRAQAVVHRSGKWHAVFIDAARFTRLFKIENAISPPLFHFSGDRIGQAALTEDEDIFDNWANSHVTTEQSNVTLTALCWCLVLLRGLRVRQIGPIAVRFEEPVVVIEDESEQFRGAENVQRFTNLLA